MRKGQTLRWKVRPCLLLKLTSFIKNRRCFINLLAFVLKPTTLVIKRCPLIFSAADSDAEGKTTSVHHQLSHLLGFDDSAPRRHLNYQHHQPLIGIYKGKALVWNSSFRKPNSTALCPVGQYKMPFRQGSLSILKDCLFHYNLGRRIPIFCAFVSLPLLKSFSANLHRYNLDNSLVHPKKCCLNTFVFFPINTKKIFTRFDTHKLTSHIF